jgi:hypothetical protein
MNAPWSRALSATALLVSAFSACDTGAVSRADTYPVVVRSATEDGEPLAKVEVLTRGKRMGFTDEKGELRGTLKGREGEERTFDIKCPDGFRAPEERPTLQLRTLQNVEASELSVQCVPDKRMAALLVSAPGFGGLPILLHGREVGRTDTSGIAHLALRGEPRTPMRVVLDTSARPRITPPSPHKDVRIGARDEIVVFAPELTEPDPPKPKIKVRKESKKEEPVAAPVIARPEKLN